MLQGQTSGRKARADSVERIERLRPQLEAYERLCAGIGEKPADVALAWVMANPLVTAPLVGPRTIEQLEDAIHCQSLTLSTETLAKLDEIFPGPGGPAPEAYCGF